MIFFSNKYNKNKNIVHLVQNGKSAAGIGNDSCCFQLRQERPELAYERYVEFYFIS